MKYTLRRIAVSALASAIIFSSGCSVYRLVKQAEEAETNARKRLPEYESRVLQDVSNVNPYSNPAAERLTNERIIAARKLGDDTSSLNELIKSIDDVIAAMDKEIAAKGNIDQNRVRVVKALPSYVNEIISIRKSYGDYVDVVMGRYGGNKSAIQRGIPRLNEIMGYLEPYKTDSTVKKVYIMAKDTMNHGKNYLEKYRPVSRSETIKKKLDSRRYEKGKRRAEWWKRAIERARGRQQKNKLYKQAREELSWIRNESEKKGFSDGLRQIKY